MDVDLIDAGSLTGFVLLTDAAREWAAEHLPDDTPRLGSTLFVEPRHAQPIIDGMEGDGLTVAR